MLSRALSFIVLAAIWRSAGACSLATPIEPVAGFVFYGEVLEIVEAPFRPGLTFGIRIAPRLEFRVPERTSDDTYEVYPFGLAADCSSTATTRDDIADRFPLGSIVGVIGVVPNRTPSPGDIDVDVRWSTLFALRPGCDLAVLARRKHDYRGYDVPCGHYRFEANKDIALLETAPPVERLEILSRLAEYQGYVRFLDLLAKYAPDVAAGRRFLAARYGEMANLSCLATQEELDSLEWERRARWGEYCFQDDPYDARPPDTLNLYDAIAHNRLAVVEQFLAEGGDPNEPLRGTPMGWVHPLKVAVLARNEVIALALLRAGADFERSRLDAWTLASTGMANIWDFLLTQSRARLPVALETMGSACLDGYYDVIDVVTRHAFETQAAVVWPDEIVGRCLDRSTDVARLLLERGAPITRYTLSAAAQTGAIDLIRSLLERGADPFERYRASGSAGERIDGFAAIDFLLRSYEYADEAARRRIHYVLHELADGPPPMSGMRVGSLARNAYDELEDHADPVGRLEFAARFGLYDAARELLAENEDLTPEALRTALRAALEGRNPDVARLLLESGMPVGGGALHIAVQTGSAGFVKHLIALGADVDEPVDDRVPLESWLASERRDGEIIQVLVAAGADVCNLVAKFEPDFWSRATVVRAAEDCER